MSKISGATWISYSKGYSMLQHVGVCFGVPVLEAGIKGKRLPRPEP